MTKPQPAHLAIKGVPLCRARSWEFWVCSHKSIAAARRHRDTLPRHIRDRTKIARGRCPVFEVLHGTPKHREAEEV